jgi:hypothetical protein
MSRTNPYKRPRRAVKATALIVVEGETEEAFCKYLKMHYNRDCGLAVTIHNGYGFGPDSIIEQARKQCCQKSFDRVFILMDEDLDITLQKSHRTVRSLGVVIWRSGPQCIEGFFFKLLGKTLLLRAKSARGDFISWLFRKVRNWSGKATKSSSPALRWRNCDIFTRTWTI